MFWTVFLSFAKDTGRLQRSHGVASPVFKDLSLLDNLWKELKLRAEKQQPRNLKEPTQFLTSM